MEKHIEVIKQSMNLLETVKEGLQHIQKLSHEGKYEATIQLFENVVFAFSTVEKSLDFQTRLCLTKWSS